MSVAALQNGTDVLPSANSGATRVLPQHICHERTAVPPSPNLKPPHGTILHQSACGLHLQLLVATVGFCKRRHHSYAGCMHAGSKGTRLKKAGQTHPLSLHVVVQTKERTKGMLAASMPGLKRTELPHAASTDSRCLKLFIHTHKPTPPTHTTGCAVCSTCKTWPTAAA
jgi:hypothetical protein